MSQEEERKDFNVQTHYWDSKTRKCAKKDPYRMHHVKGIQYWERPAGSGNLFYKNGEKAGRISDFINLSIDKGADHIEWARPKTEAEVYDLKQYELSTKLKEAQAELAAIKQEKKYADQEKKAAAKHAEPIVHTKLKVAPKGASKK